MPPDKTGLLNALEVASVFLGIFSATVSGRLAYRAMRRTTSLTRAFGYMVAAECFVSLMVLVFAVFAMNDQLHLILPEYKNAARVVMFAVTAVTSLHLSHCIDRFDG